LLNDGTTLTPQLRAHWRHQFLDIEDVTTATLADGTAGPFQVQGPSFGDDTVYVGPGLLWQISHTANVFATYDFQVSERHTSHGGSAGFHWIW
jgi:outer membrane autotransporter protein